MVRSSDYLEIAVFSELTECNVCHYLDSKTAHLPSRATTDPSSACATREPTLLAVVGDELTGESACNRKQWHATASTLFSFSSLIYWRLSVAVQNGGGPKGR